MSIEALPANPYAERMVLGGLLVNGERIREFADVLDARDFSVSRHGIYWRLMLDLSAAGLGIDRVTLARSLQAHGEFESTGGLSAIVDLDEGMPELLNLDSYVAIVRDCGIRRRTIFAAQEIAERAALTTGTTTELLDGARTLLSGLAADATRDQDFMTPCDVIQQAGGIDAYCRQQCESGIEFPWPRLTRETSGAQPGDLVIVAADTGRGKTAFAINYALYAAERGIGVAFFSLEMKARQILNRLMALSARFDSRAFRRREKGLMEERNILEASGHITELPLYIRDQSACTTASLMGAMQRLRATRQIGLVVVDYLQLLTGRGNSRVEQVGSIARGLKNAAMELGVPIVALSQFSRDHSKNNAEPQLHDLKESSEIEQAANLVLFLHGETRYDLRPNELLPIELIVAKQRDGASRFKVPLLFQADCGKFVEATR